MDKILIVGNGLTANLIPEYQHKAMMKKIKEEVPLLFDKADKLFAPFRNKVYNCIERNCLCNFT